MSDKINDGGPVFPHIDTDEPTAAGYTSKPGMTLRDYFAAQSLHVAHENFAKSVRDDGDSLSYEKDTSDAELLAQSAYAIADAMLAARNGGAA